MSYYSRRGKPRCDACCRLATHTLRVSSGGCVVYAYQCESHKYPSSALLLPDSLLYQDLFLSWLTVRADAVVGLVVDGRHCPLAHFYTDLFGVTCVVSFDGWVRGSGGLSLRLPGWALAFLNALDVTWPRDSIIGREALGLFDQLEKPTQNCSPEPVF